MFSGSVVTGHCHGPGDRSGAVPLFSEFSSQALIHPGGRSEPLRLGYLPLVDSAPLLVADALDLFRKHDVRVTLRFCPSWTVLRDDIAVRSLEGGNLVAQMAIAGALGLGGAAAPCVVTATTSRNGNTLVLGEPLVEDVLASGATGSMPRPLQAASFAAALARRHARGKRAPVLALVFATHSYLLRHWLASAGLDPDRDVRIVAVPPDDVADQLSAGRIDGFYAGEPWGSSAVAAMAGRIALTTADIWPGHPEKILAFHQATLQAAPGAVVAATAAVIAAIKWLDQPANRRDAAALLRARALPDVPEEIILRALSGRLVYAPGEAPATAAELFFAGSSTSPDPRHGAWWFGQMQRWQHVPMTLPTPVPIVWRPDLWREAALAAGVINPSVRSFAGPLV
jgi:NitT/TauT family transport system ATP-binding protein/nitrate/nitrite transport system substrate-binding protein